MTEFNNAARTRFLDRTKTREFLSRVKKHPGLVDEYERHTLHEQETARHISQAAKTLWLLSIRTNMDSISAQLEEVFYKSYLAANGNRPESTPDHLRHHAVFEQELVMP